MVQKILHIHRYGERFEMPKNMGGCETKGLSFFRHFVDVRNNSGNANYYFAQVSRLRSFENDLALEGLFFRLVVWASTYNKGYRGFVFAYEYEAAVPADVADIALHNRRSVESCQKMLDQLEQVKLIEWVDFCPHAFPLVRLPERPR